MKIIYTLLSCLFFLGCQKHLTKNEMNLMPDDMHFVPNKSMEIKKLPSFKGKYTCIGSYIILKDTVITEFKVESKYSILVIRLNNISNNCEFNNHLHTDYPTPGYFETISDGLCEVNLNPALFQNNYKINKIDFFSDSKIQNQIKNDSIKSFSLNFNKYAIKINNAPNKLIYSKIEYYGLKNLNANMLFYNVENETYIFIMTPLKKNIILDKNILYDYLFDNKYPKSKKI